MNETLAIFLHTYRELNSKKLFWFAIGLSGLMVLAFIVFGLSTKGIDILGVYYIWEAERPLPEDFVLEQYRRLFNDFAVSWGLGLVVTLLALISTAGVFPSMMSDGAIDLVLSRPISRVRLFLTKYVACLLFVFIQLLVFCLVCFLVFGIRLGVWEWGVFVVAPMVLLYFSYLFCICVLMGVLTRSTIASLIVAGLFWVVLGGLNFADYQTLSAKASTDASTIATDDALPMFEAQFQIYEISGATWRPPSEDQIEIGAWGEPIVPDPEPVPEDSEIEDKDRVNALNNAYHGLYVNYLQALYFNDTNESFSNLLGNINWWVTALKAPLPKTDETIDYSKRALAHMTSLQESPLLSLEDESEPLVEGGQDVSRDMARQQDRLFREKLKERYHGRTTFWVIGTSLLFEFIVLGLAAFLFHRRDF